jgi:hypothetical protein
MKWLALGLIVAGGAGMLAAAEADRRGHAFDTGLFLLALGGIVLLAVGVVLMLVAAFLAI